MDVFYNSHEMLFTLLVHENILFFPSLCVFQAAIYCHLCLNRQLRQGPFTSSDSLREWVTNCIGLSFFYTGRKMFQQAHHCLLAAQHFIPKEDFLTKPITPQE